MSEFGCAPVECAQVAEFGCRAHSLFFESRFFQRFVMVFLLRRGGLNVPLEVQRWQYFLLTNKTPQGGVIDAQFGAKTEEAARIFQVQRDLKPTGRLDLATLEAAKSHATAFVSICGVRLHDSTV